MIESGSGDFVAVELIDLYSDIRTRYSVSFTQAVALVRRLVGCIL